MIVIYGIGVDFDGDIKCKDLIMYILYNIYKIKGLLLILIVMLLKVVLFVVVNLFEFEYVYFVLKGDGSY